jgi:hypothetical protein
MRKDQKSVWVIIHCEWMGKPNKEHVDEMIFHVVSSRKIAERYMASTEVMKSSWWKLERHRIDDLRHDALATHYYTITGKPLVSLAISKYQMRALAFYRKLGR